MYLEIDSNIYYTNWYGSPSIGPDGTIILSGNGEYITALNPINHSVIWQYRIGDSPHVSHVSEVTIGTDGTVYFAYTAYNNCIAFLCALKRDGSLKWETSLTTDFLPYDCVDVFSNPSIESDGTVYITSTFWGEYQNDGYVYAIGKDNATTPNPHQSQGQLKLDL